MMSLCNGQARGPLLLFKVVQYYVTCKNSPCDGLRWFKLYVMCRCQKVKNVDYGGGSQK